MSLITLQKVSGGRSSALANLLLGHRSYNSVRMKGVFFQSLGRQRGFWPKTTPTINYSLIRRQITDSANKETKADEGIGITYNRGLPQLTIPLPSRRERCRFIVKPLTNTVGDLTNMIKHEDKGVDRVSFKATDGVRIASSNTIEMLMEHDFDLIINDDVFRVLTPELEKPSEEELRGLSSLRTTVGQLYATLNVEEAQLAQERQLLSTLEALRSELLPLEEKKAHLDTLCHRRNNKLTWLGLGLMSVQFGILARLTWWEYSWDIMEPVTYFVTYGTAMLAYAYFVLTKQEYVLPDVVDRQYLITFHKNAKKVGLDVGKYNEIREKVWEVEGDLRRLRDPLALNLPFIRPIKDVEGEEQGAQKGILNRFSAFFKKSAL